ncbi:MAG: saccharopine dehydrogenase C-terminal domain-containing protein [Calditrichaceae bacterium]
MNILIIGAGRMAHGLVHDFLNLPDLQSLQVVDNSPESLKILNTKFKNNKLSTALCAADDIENLKPYFQSASGAISAVPYDYNLDLTKLAIQTKTHFVDLGGNNDVVEKQFALNEQARSRSVGIIPDCGLAPGMVSVIAAHVCDELAEVDNLKIRVGGLPVSPKPPLNYMLVFSPHGLINEYIEPAVILEDGKITTRPSMTEVEQMEFPQPFGLLEAFYTSGGTSTLPQTFENKVNYLDYKTIRYPGHCHIFKAMLDLGFADETEFKYKNIVCTNREIFERMLVDPLTYESEDAVLIRVTATGQKAGSIKTVQYQCIDYQDRKTGLTAMMRCTSFPAAIILQMLVRGDIKDQGVLRQEISVPGRLFMAELEKRMIKFDRLD